MIMSDIKENDERNLDDLTDEELDAIVGGVGSIVDGSVTITWDDGDQMNKIWEVVDGYRSAFNSWGISVETVKDLIRNRAHEKLGKKLRYWATVGDKVTVTKNGVS
jgi:hypothetical protein